RLECRPPPHCSGVEGVCLSAVPVSSKAEVHAANIKGGTMTIFSRAAMTLCLVTTLVLSVGGAARAANRVFLSTSLEASQASYTLDLRPVTGGIVDKLRLAFPGRALGGGGEPRDLLIDGKVAKPPIVTPTAPADPDALFVDVRLTAIIRSGTPVVLELMG